MRKIVAMAMLAVTLISPIAANACGGGNPYPPKTRLAVGMHAMTTYTESGDPVAVRAQPGYDGKYLTQLYNGTKITVVAGPVAASGYLYYKVVTDDGKI